MVNACLIFSLTFIYNPLMNRILQSWTYNRLRISTRRGGCDHDLLTGNRPSCQWLDQMRGRLAAKFLRHTWGHLGTFYWPLWSFRKIGRSGMETNFCFLLIRGWTWKYGNQAPLVLPSLWHAKRSPEPELYRMRYNRLFILQHMVWEYDFDKIACPSPYGLDLTVGVSKRSTHRFQLWWNHRSLKGANFSISHVNNNYKTTTGNH